MAKASAFDARVYPTLAERFWTKVDTSRGPDACWPWTGASDRLGYGYIALGAGHPGRSERAHRVAFALADGPIPPSVHVCHRCDNPPCCNRRHLYAGNPGTNARDRERRRRRIPPTGERNGRAKITHQQVRQIRDRYARGGLTMDALADEFGLSRSSISGIIRKETWHGEDPSI